MNFFQKIIARVFLGRAVLSGTLNQGYKPESKWDRKRPLSAQVINMKQYRVTVDVSALEKAVMQAENPDNPYRIPLYVLYDKIVKDGHLKSQIKKARNSITMMPFRVINEDSEVENKEATKYFHSSWFIQFLSFCFEAELWGHSLMEVAEIDKSEGFSKIKKLALIPRINVRPEAGIVALYYTDMDGIHYREYMEKLLLLEYFGDESLGDLEYIAKEIIYKRYARTDWAEVSERFGKPFLVIKTASDDEVELNKKEEMAKNFGSSGWAILDDQDEISFLESKSTDSWEVFSKQIELSDNNNSKLLNGETMTSDVGSNGSRSQAEVHERTAGKFLYARLQKIEIFINESLFPLMIRMGYPLTGMKFEYPVLKEAPEQVSPEESPEEAPGSGDVSTTKKKSPTVSQSHRDGCCTPVTYQYLSIPVTNFNDDEKIYLPLLESVAKRLANGEINEEEMETELYLTIANAFQSGYESGYGRPLLTASGTYDLKSVARFNTIRNNLFAFSGAKTYAQMNELRDYLYDNGKLRPLTDILTKAKEVNAKYNVSYLETERDFVIRAGTMGSRWADIERDKSQYPYLRYVTAGDGRVRPEHAAMDGITLPVDSSFWNQYLPPNGWNCRCDVEQVSEPEKVNDTDSASKTGAASVPKNFRRNYAKSELFEVDGHPYFKSIPGKEGQLKAEEHYGMKSWENINKSNLPELKSITAEELDTLWVQLKEKYIDDGKGGFIVPDINTGLFAHFYGDKKSNLKEKLISKGRIYGNAIEEIIQNPDEIWGNYLAGKHGEEYFSVFIKYYKDIPLVLVVSKTNKVDSLYPLDRNTNSRLGQMRMGVLLYKK